MTAEKKECYWKDKPTECRGTPEEVVLIVPETRRRLHGFLCPAHLEQALKGLAEAGLQDRLCRA